MLTRCELAVAMETYMAGATRDDAKFVTYNGEPLATFLDGLDTTLSNINLDIQNFQDADKVQDVEALRVTEPKYNGQVVHVIGYTQPGIGGGLFRHVPGGTLVDDGGWNFVTDTGTRWARIAVGPNVRLDDCGAVPGGNIDAALERAYAICWAFNKVVIDITPTDFYSPYVVTESHDWPLPMGGIVLQTQGTYGSAAIDYQSTDGYAFTFRQGGAPAALFAHAGVRNLRITGNIANPKGALRFQNTWGNFVHDCWFSNFNAGSPVTLENTVQWTENFILKNILSRGNKSLLRCIVNGGTDSFYALKLEQVYHQFGVGNSRLLEAGDAVNKALVYGVDADFGGWFEAGGGHVVILANGSSEVYGRGYARMDGFGGLMDGSDMRILRATSANARIDFDLQCSNQQGKAFELRTWNTATKYGGIRHLLSSNTPDTVNTARSIVRAKGASLLLQQTNITTNRIITINQLPSFTTWRAVLTVDGDGHQTVEEYTISVGRNNWIAAVVNNSRASGAPASTDFCLRTFGGATSGAFQSGDGNQFDWVINAATGTGAYNSSLELIMQ